MSTQYHGDEVFCTSCKQVLGYRNTLTPPPTDESKIVVTEVSGQPGSFSVSWGEPEPVLMLLDYWKAPSGQYVRPKNPRADRKIEGRQPEGRYLEISSDASDEEWTRYIARLQADVKTNNRPIQIVGHTEIIRRGDLPATIKCAKCAKETRLVISECKS